MIWNDNAWPLSSAGPADSAVAHPAMVCAAASSLTIGFAPFTKLGPSFTGLTVIVNERATLVSTPPFAVPPSSRTAAVIVATPFAFGAGV